MAPSVCILDGPTGTELARRGVATPAPVWSAEALRTAPDVLAAIHDDYVQAGATVHTAATFRTRRRAAGDDWTTLTDAAVALLRSRLPPGAVLAGSIAPLEDCYRPDLSPPSPGPEHAELAERLVLNGVDMLLCETFPHVGEGLAATAAACGRGVPVWTSFSAGYRGDLLTPAQVADGARAAVDLGAEAVLVNCVPATHTLPFVEALVAAVGDRVAVGAYANAGPEHGGLGWGRGAEGAHQYVRLAESWVSAGATLIGGCCGTEPATIAALVDRFGRGALHTSTHVGRTGEKGGP
jgi:S-methylmethionine-dependent homocysteine/selenocysteine methylase